MRSVPRSASRGSSRPSTTCADTEQLESAARALGRVGRDQDELALQFPSDGDVQSLGALLDLLDAESVDVAELSFHTRDLDDVYFALTGNNEKEPVR
jgi:ABC-2 type transport system ATP-binding protein